MTITNYVSEFEIIQEPLNYSESKYVTKAFEVLSQRNDVTMVFSHPNRSTFIYCASDESGMIGLYIKEKNVESRLLLNNKELGHASKELLFVLHNSQDIIYMIMDKDGSKNHYITEYNYTSKESRIIAENLDWITVFYEIDNNSLLCIGNREKSMVVYKLDKFNGKETILYTSDLQILSSDYSSEINVLLISEGRGYANIVALDVTNGEEIFRLKESDSSSDRFMSISPNGSSFCYISNVSGTEELIVRSINDRMIIGRTPIPGSGIGFFALDLSYVNWANDNEIVALVTHQGQSQPYKYNIDLKEWHKLLSKYQVLLQLRRTSMGLVFPGGNSSTSYHLFLYSDQNVSKITFPSFQSDGQDKISIWFNSRDGMKIHGWLTRANDPMARLIVIPHGGPSYVDMDNYDPFTSIFVNAGYHVLQPNFRGSTTFGVEYRNALKGDMGGNEVWDVIEGTKYVQKLLGLTKKPLILGGSYGGFLTIMGLLKEPDLYLGGCAFVPIADLVTNWKVADAHYKQFMIHFLGGSYEEIPDKYKERSPLTYIDNLKVPLLLIAGKNDPQAYFEPTENFYRIAKEKGKQIYSIFTDTGHGSGNKEELLFTTTNALIFLKYLEENYTT